MHQRHKPGEPLHDQLRELAAITLQIIVPNCQYRRHFDFSLESKSYELVLLVKTETGRSFAQFCQISREDAIFANILPQVLPELYRVRFVLKGAQDRVLAFLPAALHRVLGGRPGPHEDEHRVRLVAFRRIHFTDVNPVFPRFIQEVQLSSKEKWRHQEES